MKKILHRKLLLSILCSLFFSTLLNAQLSGFFLIPSPVNTCGPVSVFEIQMAPGATASTGNVITVMLPAGIQYVSGSATVNNGATISGVTGTAVAPVFSIPTLAAGPITSLTFSVTANCNYVGGQGFNASATGTVGNTPQATSPSINVQSAVFVLPTSTDFSSFTGVVLQTYDRTATVRNTGSGIADTVLILDTIGKGRTLNSLSASGGIGVSLVSKVAVNGGNDTAWAWKVYNFSGAVNGNSDVVLNQGEEFILTQSLTIVGCTNLTDNFYAAPYCVGTGGCNRGLLTGGVTLPATAQPVLSMVSQPFSGIYPIYRCTDGSVPYSSSVALYNNSSSPAYNVKLTLGTDEGGSGFSNIQGNAWYENLQLKINNGSYAPATPDSIQIVPAGVGKCAVGKPWLVGITIPVILPGDSIRLSYDAYHCTPTETCLPITLFLYEGLSATLSYTDQCQTGTINAPYTIQIGYGLASYPMTKGNNLVNIYPNSNNTLIISANGNISTAQFLPSGSFAYRMRVPSFLSMPTNPADVDLAGPAFGLVHPASITLVSSTATDNTYDVLFNTSQVGSSGTLFSNNLSIRNVMGLPCTGAGTIKAPIETQFLIRSTNEACNPFVNVSCLTDTVAYVCPNLCPGGGITGSQFTLMRTNLGLPDNNNDGVADAGPLDMTKVRFDKAFLGDTIAATATGKVLVTGTNFTNGYFEPQIDGFDITNPAQRLQALDARISVYDAAGVLRGSCSNLPLLSTGTGTNKVRADFSTSVLSGCIPGYTQFVNGDSLAITIRYKNNYQGNLPDAPILSSLVAGYFYLSDVVNPTATSNIYACDTSYSSLTLVSGYILIAPGSVQSSGCDTISAGFTFYQSVGPCCGNYGNNHFPYEVRNFNVPASLALDLTGYRYAGKTEVIYYSQNGGTPLPYDISNQRLPNAPYILHMNLRNIWADKGGPFRLPDEGWFVTVRVKLLPECISGQRTVITGASGYYAGVTDTVDFLQGASNGMVNIINGPAVTVTTSPQTQTVTTNTAVWELQVSNASSLATSNNTWLAKGNGGTTTIQSLELLSGPGGTVVSTVPSVGGLFQLGTLPTGSNQYYRATVGYANCVKDTLNLAYGYSCAGYPASLSAATCNFTAPPLYIVPQPSLFQLSLLTQPVNPQTLCVDTTYILQLSNAQPGNAYSPTITAILPATNFAVTGNSSQVEYPAGTFTTISDPVLVNGKYQWDLSSVLPGGALPGNGTSLKLKFNAQATGCGFVSGDYPVFGAQGLSGCGQPVTVPTISGNPFILGGDPLNTVNNFILTKEVTTTSLLACPGQSFTYTYSARNNGVGPSNASTEALEIEVPSWLTLVPGSFSTIKNPPASTTPTVVPLGSITSYRWNMPAGVVVGDTVKFSVQFAPGDALAVSCGSRFTIRNIVTNTFTTSAAACLGGGSCSVRTIKGLDTVSIAVEKYNLQPTYLYVTPGVNDNVIALKITNAGSRAYSGTMMYAVYADMNGDGVLDAGDVQVSPTLTSTQPLGANAVDTFSNVISLSGASLDPSVLGKQTLLVVKDSSCNCTNTYIAAIAASVGLPLELISFTGVPKGKEVGLQWTVAQQVNTDHFEVERSDDGIHWTKLGSVKAAGTYAGTLQYEYTDGAPHSGTNYYRLKMVDADGKYSYSPVVKVNTEVLSCFSSTGLYPVPFTTELNIGLYSCKQKAATFTLYTAHGKKLLEEKRVLTAGSSYYTLHNLGHLPAGTYVIRVQTDTDVLVEKTVKY